MRLIGLVVAVLTLFGCREHFYADRTPPAPPQGIHATALDNAVEVTWLRNGEPDVAGYKVWVSDHYDGKYSLLGRTVDPIYTDYGANNGVRAYYAVTAYDFDGNESELSQEVIYVTPRPEGFGTHINNFRSDPSQSGYDFSTYSVGPYDDDYTDVFFEVYNGHAYLDVWDDSDIQDMGYTGSLYEIAVAPASGWSTLRSVEAIPGHTYIVWTWDDHYAKIRVREVTGLRVTFDWAYQIDPSNPDLKRNLPKDGRRLFKPMLAAPRAQ